MRDHPLIDLALAFAMCAVIGLLMTPLLWPYDRMGHLWTLAKGAGMLAGGSLGLAIVLAVFRRMENVRIVVNSLAAMACAVVTAHYLVTATAGVSAGMPGWAAGLAWFFGLLSCWGASEIWSVAFPGTIYRLASLVTVAIAYGVFAII